MAINPAQFAALIFDSPMDIAVVVLIALILFGGKKIPELMRGLGQGIKEFRTGMREEPSSPPPPTQAAPPPASSAPATADKK